MVGNKSGATKVRLVDHSALDSHVSAAASLLVENPEMVQDGVQGGVQDGAQEAQLRISKRSRKGKKKKEPKLPCKCRKLVLIYPISPTARRTKNCRV